MVTPTMKLKSLVLLGWPICELFFLPSGSTRWGRCCAGSARGSSPIARVSPAAFMPFSTERTVPVAFSAASRARTAEDP